MKASDKATDLAPLSVPEVRRLVCAAAVAAPEQQRYLLAWSRFRRRHQAGAGRAHTRRRGREQQALESLSGPPVPAAPGPALQLAGTATLTETTWNQMVPLLPPLPLQVAPTRTRYDHRQVLEGILAVMRSGRSWRDAPRAQVTQVPWPILYQRYSLWRRRGIWDAILHILHPDEDLPLVT
jgi:transposase